MKARVAPGFNLYQIVIQDFSRRETADKHLYVNRNSKGKREIVETVPLITKLKWAKKPKNAMSWAKKFGSVISCHKVDSHIRKLNMIEHLRIDTKPIEVDIGLNDFIMRSDLTIESGSKKKSIDIE